MDCARFEELTFAAFDGPLTEAVEDARRAHAAGCERCARLAELIGPEGVADEATPPGDFLESVLRSTSPAWARTFEVLDHDLAELSELEPDEGFVGDVLAVTTGATPHGDTAPLFREQRRRRFAWARLAAGRIDTERWAAAWQALLRRPRLAFEGAYVGAMLLVLVAGTPAWSLSISPRQLISEIRTEQVAPVVASVNRRVEPVVSTAGHRVTGFFSATWSSARGRAGQVANGVQAAIASGQEHWCATVGCPEQEPDSSEQESQEDR